MGCLPPASVIRGSVPLMSPGSAAALGASLAAPGTATLTTSMGVPNNLAVRSALSPESPVSALWHGDRMAPKSGEAVVVSMNSPPIPGKLAEKIWRNEFIELDSLLPSRLGAPEPTIQDLVYGERRKEKKGITSIQEWVGCFNTYIAVVSMKDSSRVKDLLAYSSLIVKASSDYVEEAWLGYDSLFRRQAAAEPTLFTCWGQISPPLWTQHFGIAASRIPCWSCGSKEHKKCASGSSHHNRRSDSRFRPYPDTPVCKRWNWGSVGCSADRCNFRHVCAHCSGDHQAKRCPKQSGTRKESMEKKGERSGEPPPFRP